MPTYKVRALVDGRMRRSWGESPDEAAARAAASSQLSRLTNDFEIVTVEEVDEVEADVERLLGELLELDTLHVPKPE